MIRIKLAHTLAAIVAAVAVLSTLEGLSKPLSAQRPDAVVVVVLFALLAVHAAAYRFGDRIRERFGLKTYVATQAAILFAIAVSRPPAPISVGVFMAGTVELVVLAGASWGTVPITLGAIGLFVAAALVTTDLYRASTAGMILAVTGLVAHAVAALLPRPAVVVAPAPAVANEANGLSLRETDVLRELVSGARNSDIASKLGISERTVKAHLGSIYQKLGVETRSAAVAAAMQRKLV
jgi:DNA-binding CsgD family transcriptional regulator